MFYSLDVNSANQNQKNDMHNTTIINTYIESSVLYDCDHATQPD